jgi:hypothetical protein
MRRKVRFIDRGLISVMKLYFSLGRIAHFTILSINTHETLGTVYLEQLKGDDKCHQRAAIRAAGTVKF